MLVTPPSCEPCAPQYWSLWDTNDLVTESHKSSVVNEATALDLGLE